MILVSWVRIPAGSPTIRSHSAAIAGLFKIRCGLSASLDRHFPCATLRATTTRVPSMEALRLYDVVPRAFAVAVNVAVKRCGKTTPDREKPSIAAHCGE